MEELTDFFDRLKMPEACIRRIASAVEEKQRMPRKEEYTMMQPTSNLRRGWGMALAVACLALVVTAGLLVLRGNDTQTVATAPTADTETIESLEGIRQVERDFDDLQRESERLRQVLEGKDIVCEDLELRDGRVYLTYEGKEYDITDGIPEDLVPIDTPEEAETDAPIRDWLLEERGKLYFVKGGDRVYAAEITEKISPEEPWLYGLVQGDGTVLFIAIGGTYDTEVGIGSVGWYRNAWDETGGWGQGQGRDFLDTVWYQTAVEKMEEVRETSLLQYAAKVDFEDGLRYTEGNVTYIYSNGSSWMNCNTQLHTPFTEVADGRVYFTANGEHLDITEEFSKEEPFTYIFTDSHFLIHYIAIGGTAQNPGYLEMIHKSWEIGEGAFVTGSGTNTWNNEASARYGWEQRAKEIFEPYGVYWTS